MSGFLDKITFTPGGGFKAITQTSEEKNAITSLALEVVKKLEADKKKWFRKERGILITETPLKDKTEINIKIIEKPSFFQRNTLSETQKIVKQVLLEKKFSQQPSLAARAQIPEFYLTEEEKKLVEFLGKRKYQKLLQKHAILDKDGIFNKYNLDSMDEKWDAFMQEAREIRKEAFYQIGKENDKLLHYGLTKEDIQEKLGESFMDFSQGENIQELVDQTSLEKLSAYQSLVEDIRESRKEIHGKFKRLDFKNWEKESFSEISKHLNDPKHKLSTRDNEKLEALKKSIPKEGLTDQELRYLKTEYESLKTAFLLINKCNERMMLEIGKVSPEDMKNLNVPLGTLRREYGPFRKKINLLAEGKLTLDGFQKELEKLPLQDLQLFGIIYSIFKNAKNGESAKAHLLNFLRNEKSEEEMTKDTYSSIHYQRLKAIIGEKDFSKLYPNAPIEKPISEKVKIEEIPQKKEISISVIPPTRGPTGNKFYNSYIKPPIEAITLFFSKIYEKIVFGKFASLGDSLDRIKIQNWTPDTLQNLFQHIIDTSLPLSETEKGNLTLLQGIFPKEGFKKEDLEYLKYKLSSNMPAYRLIKLYNKKILQETDLQKFAPIKMALKKLDFKNWDKKSFSEISKYIISPFHPLSSTDEEKLKALSSLIPKEGLNKEDLDYLKEKLSTISEAYTMIKAYNNQTQIQKSSLPLPTLKDVAHDLQKAAEEQIAPTLENLIHPQANTVPEPKKFHISSEVIMELQKVAYGQKNFENLKNQIQQTTQSLILLPYTKFLSLFENIQEISEEEFKKRVENFLSQCTFPPGSDGENSIHQCAYLIYIRLIKPDLTNGQAINKYMELISEKLQNILLGAIQESISTELGEADRKFKADCIERPVESITLNPYSSSIQSLTFLKKQIDETTEKPQIENYYMPIINESLRKDFRKYLLLFCSQAPTVNLSRLFPFIPDYMKKFKPQQDSFGDPIILYGLDISPKTTGNKLNQIDFKIDIEQPLISFNPETFTSGTTRVGEITGSFTLSLVPNSSTNTWDVRIDNPPKIITTFTDKDFEASLKA